MAEATMILGTNPLPLTWHAQILDNYQYVAAPPPPPKCRKYHRVMLLDPVAEISVTLKDANWMLCDTGTPRGGTVSQRADLRLLF